ncbi:hypothetical protein NDU88_004751 [Pleurodeles waltl]|uniref:Uncharacterized protein n=1 Tax=Pleurodeles waltl TaxID=8319 RepID=A0AAV7LMB7_PLEWA|nr:hypothetical protein NDU88_004751 [Pleurodeles waltl]
MSTWPDRPCLVGGHCDRAAAEKPGSQCGWCHGGMFEQSAASSAGFLDTSSNLIAATHRKSEDVLEVREGKSEEEDTVWVNKEEVKGEVKDQRRDDDVSTEPGGH